MTSVPGVMNFTNKVMEFVDIIFWQIYMGKEKKLFKGIKQFYYRDIYSNTKEPSTQVP